MTTWRDVWEYAQSDRQVMLRLITLITVTLITLGALAWVVFSV